MMTSGVISIYRLYWRPYFIYSNWDANGQLHLGFFFEFVYYHKQLKCKIRALDVMCSPVCDKR